MRATTTARCVGHHASPQYHHWQLQKKPEYHCDEDGGDDG
jgi:hypothetical protein